MSLPAFRQRTLSVTFAAAALAFLVGAAAANATVVVAPNEWALIDPVGGNGFPFLGSSRSRYQQVYASDQFSAFSGPELITEIAFRLDTPSPATTITIPEVTVDLSTTSAIPDAGAGTGGLSLTWAANIGPDAVRVFDDELTLTATTTGGDPNPFEFVIPLSTPFLYDPSAGNLLMDVVRQGVGGGIGPTVSFRFMDAASFLVTQPDSVSRISGSQFNASATFEDETGLITRFTTAAVPEPSVLALFGLGLAGICVMRRSLSG